MTLFFFFNDTATTEIYTLSLHDALPISREVGEAAVARKSRPWEITPQDFFEGSEEIRALFARLVGGDADGVAIVDRKSTRLNSSHANISYAVFCLKKKKKK